MTQIEQELHPFNYTYIKALEYYQKCLIDAIDSNFFYDQLTVQTTKTIQISIKSLKQGPNNEAHISATTLRTLFLEQAVLFLATTQLPITSNSLFVGIAVYPNAPSQPELPNKSNPCWKPYSHILAKSPFRSIQQKQPYPLLIFAYPQIQLQKQCKVQFSSCQKLRQQANLHFKTQKYVQAIQLYEKAITSMRTPDRKVLSILYANSAACLFQLRLYESCSILSSIALALEHTYSKAHYRKIKSLLQLGRYQEVAPYFLKIYTLIHKDEINTLNLKFSHYVSQKNGMIDWIGLIDGSVPQGRYQSQKIKKVITDVEVKLVAVQDIQAFQLLYMCRPLLYIHETGAKFKQSFLNFLQQVQKYYLFDDEFEQNIHMLPCSCHPFLSKRKQRYQKGKGEAKPITKKQLFNKMQRCIFEQRALDKTEQQNGYGVWKEMFYFQNNCNPNCTGVHLNSYWLVNALKPIKKGTILSIDLISDVESSKRKETLKIKFQRDCYCEVCRFQQLQFSFDNIEQLYDYVQELQNSKIKKQCIWSLINNYWDAKEGGSDEDCINLIYYYIYYIQKQCEWDDFLNLLRIKQLNKNQDADRHIDESLKRSLVKFFNLNEKDADSFYQIVISKYMKKTKYTDEQQS